MKTPVQIIRRRQLQSKLGLSCSTIYARMSTDPTFPKPIRLGGQAVGWIEGEIETWLAAQIAKRARKAVAP